MATARYFKEKYPGKSVFAAGEGPGAVLVIYSAVLDPQIDGVMLGGTRMSLMSEGMPALLNALRVCDIPEAIGLIAPRRVELLVSGPDVVADPVPRSVDAIFEAAGAGGNLVRP